MKSEQTNELRELQHSILKMLSAISSKSDKAHKDITNAIQGINEQIKTLTIVILLIGLCVVLATTASYFGYSELKEILQIIK